jgi:hypothetical protein
MKSFWFPTSQCLATPQMYHLFLGVSRGITSFTLVRVPLLADVAHCWKLVPLTLITLCAPSGYLKTAPKSWFLQLAINIKWKLCTFIYFSRLLTIFMQAVMKRIITWLFVEADLWTVGPATELLLRNQGRAPSPNTWPSANLLRRRPYKAVS